MSERDFVIEGFTADETCCDLKARIPEDLRYFEGHFEGDPIVPGIAQLLPLVWDQARRAWPDLSAPSAITRLKFKGALRPGHALRVRLERKPGAVSFEVHRLEEGDLETLCTRGKLVVA